MQNLLLTLINKNKMKHFTTKDGQTLGTTFCGDKGRTLMQTKAEEKLMWTLDDKDLVLCDGVKWLAGEMMDLFLKESSRCSKEEFLRRGWKESRWSEGLSMQLGLSKEGKTLLMR